MLAACGRTGLWVPELEAGTEDAAPSPVARDGGVLARCGAPWMGVDATAGTCRWRLGARRVRSLGGFLGELSSASGEVWLGWSGTEEDRRMRWWVQRLDAAGRPLTAPTGVWERALGAGAIANPARVLGCGGRRMAVVADTSRRAGIEDRVAGTALDLRGVALAPPTTLTRGTAIRFELFEAAWATPEGYAMTVWDDAPTRTRTWLTFDEAAAPQRALSVLSPSANFASAAPGANGATLFLWGDRPPEGSPSRLWAQTFDREGSPRGAASEVFSTPRGSIFSAVAVTLPDGSHAVAWDQGSRQRALRRLDAVHARLGPVVELAPVEDILLLPIALAVSGGELFTAWQEPPGATPGEARRVLVQALPLEHVPASAPLEVLAGARCEVLQLVPTEEGLLVGCSRQHPAPATTLGRLAPASWELTTVPLECVR